MLVLERVELLEQVFVHDLQRLLIVHDSGLLVSDLVKVAARRRASSSGNEALKED
jgi:hypothetical protein